MDLTSGDVMLPLLNSQVLVRRLVELGLADLRAEEVPVGDYLKIVRKLSA